MSSMRCRIWDPKILWILTKDNKRCEINCYETLLYLVSQGWVITSSKKGCNETKK